MASLGYRRGGWELRYRDDAREEREVIFGVYYERWLASRRISKAREFTDASRARLHVLPHWADRPLSRIRPSDVDDWLGAARLPGRDRGR